MKSVKCISGTYQYIFNAFYKLDTVTQLNFESSEDVGTKIPP